MKSRFVGKDIPFTMIIDFHAHCFPDALAPRAMQQLTKTISSMHISPSTDGTTAGLIKNMDAAHIDLSVVCHISTNAHQMHKVNDFAISQKSMEHGRLIPLGSLHPHADQLEEELARLMQAGISGLKLHPDYMGFDFDDPVYDRILSLCEAHGLFLITHAGFDPLSPEHMHCTPVMVRRVMERHPTLKLVVAHLGGINCEEDTLSLLCGRNVYLDTSLLTHRPQKSEMLYQILSSHAPERLLFATDTPWTDAKAEIEALERAPLSQDVKDMIFHKNAEALLTACNPLKEV